MCRFTGKDCLHQRSTYVHYNKSEHEDLLLYIIWQKYILNKLKLKPEMVKHNYT